MLSSHPKPGLLSRLIASLWPKSVMHLNLFQTPRPSHNPGFNNPDHTCWRAQIMKLLTVQFSPSPVPTALLGTNILLSTLFANTLKLWLSLGGKSRFHTIQTNSRVLWCLCFQLWDWKTKDSDVNCNKRSQTYLALTFFEKLHINAQIHAIIHPKVIW
jgi:hypothetical protein